MPLTIALYNTLQLNISIIPDKPIMGKGGTMLILPCITLVTKESFYYFSFTLSKYPL